MSTEIRMEFDCVAAEWEVDEFLRRVGENVSAQRVYQIAQWQSGREREWNRVEAFLVVHKTYRFLKAALPEADFRAGLLDGLASSVRDLQIEIGEVEVL